jgi:hypothetical protein
MALLGKKRAISPTPSTIIIRTSVTVTDLIINIFKIPILKVVKPEPFYRLR